MTKDGKRNPEEAGKEIGQSEEFGELIRYTGAGFVGGLILGAVLDRFGLSTSGIGQWLVRTLAGEGESLLEGLFALRKRITGAAGSLAEAYGWGKLLGMVFPWTVDIISRLAGVDVNGVDGFYIPYFYALSDQIGANIAGFVFLYRRGGGVTDAVRAYVQNPVMVTSLVVILFVPDALFMARAFGFSPTTQVLTALETIAANLCWLPPLVGWMWERRKRKAS